MGGITIMVNMGINQDLSISDYDFKVILFVINCFFNIKRNNIIIKTVLIIANNIIFLLNVFFFYN